ncbi:MAG: PilN domain-containing protein [Thermoanaerobaculia bacterium]
MIRINLLTEAKAAAARKKAPILPTGARLNNLLFVGGVVAGAVGCLVWGLVQIHTKHQLDDKIATERLEADRLKAVIEEVRGYEEKKASLEAKISLINNLKTNQKGPVRLMDEVSKALPDLVWLSALDLAGDQITMKGKTLSPNAVATYLENLKKSPFFAEPVFRNLGKDGGGQGTYSWEMTLTFKPGAALASGATAPPAPGPSPGPEKTEKGT